MKKTGLIVLGLASILLTTGFGLAGNFLFAGLALLGSAAWIWLAATRGARWTNLFFVVFGLLTVIGILGDVPPLLMLASQVCYLAAWDLIRFSDRLARAGLVFDRPQIIRSHVSALVRISAVGFIFGCLTLIVRFQLSFLVIFAVAVLTFISIWLGLRAINQSELSH